MFISDPAYVGVRPDVLVRACDKHIARLRKQREAALDQRARKLVERARKAWWIARRILRWNPKMTVLDAREWMRTQPDSTHGNYENAVARYWDDRIGVCNALKNMAAGQVEIVYLSEEQATALSWALREIASEGG